MIGIQSQTFGLAHGRLVFIVVGNRFRIVQHGLKNLSNN